jgi:YHS domain-containing protein
MNAIKNSTWTMIILGAAAGCAGEGDNASAPAAGPGTTPSVEKPAASAIPPAPPMPTKSSATTKTDEAPAVEGPKTDNAKPGAPAAKLTADEIAAIKELPEAEQALATQQIVCPVSDHNLGSMGKPLKVTADGRTAYLCCDGCEEKFKKDPKAFFAKLDKK